ncbi:hypothetical protein TNCV_1005061 [Trichonephila clavipes]|nr:hypothetical protein TNCV_1005061 [Trichonephila clavipes]
MRQRYLVALSDGHQQKKWVTPNRDSVCVVGFIEDAEGKSRDFLLRVGVNVREYSSRFQPSACHHSSENFLFHSRELVFVVIPPLLQRRIKHVFV